MTSSGQRLLDADYRVNGVAAAYTAPGAAPVDCTVVLHLFSMQQRERPELSPVGFGGMKLQLAERQIFVKVRVTEIAAPVEGAVFVIADGPSAGTYKAGEAPMHATDEGIEWLCKCVKD